MELLTQEFLNTYDDAPEHMNEMAQFTFYRTYSRWLDDKQRRETFKEAIARAVDYNVSISIQQFKDNEFDVPMEQIRKEAEQLFDNIFNLRQGLSGRTHWVGGARTKVANKFPLSNFNCAFTEVNEWEDIAEIFYLLLVGTGVGISCSKDMAKNLPPIRRDYTLTHSEFKPVSIEERLEDTMLNLMDNGYAKIYVGDSKEGWVKALKIFIQIITDEYFKSVKHIKISYNSIRPKGERLKTFGGTASGYEPLKEMFAGIDKVFKDLLDETLEPMDACTKNEKDISRYYVRPIHILDICNLIGNNVVVGGVRRTAEIFLCDDDDYETIFAKYGINGIWDWVKHMEIGEEMYALGILPKWWTDKKEIEKRSTLTHRYMSNNSILFRETPSNEYLKVIFDLMKETGEPGFVNLAAAQKRRPNAKGVNPCGEILLDSKQVCNLTTVNVMAFVKDDNTLDYAGLMEAISLSVRAGIRMTCIDLELKEWDKKHKRDRLIGTSVTGWKDAMDKLEYDVEKETSLLNFMADVAFQETNKYAYILRIPTPLLNTTVKPEGTLSTVFNGVSSGLHVSHSPYYIRRIRINATDPLAQVAIELGWDVKPENGQTLDDVRTYVVSFPVHSPAKKTRAEQTLKEQFETYFNFQKNYTAHNSSNTITVREDEWEEAYEIVRDNWDDVIGITFLAYDGGTYEQTPYEECTEEEYNKLKEQMKPFSIDLLHEIESGETEKDVENMDGCEAGVCPIF